MIDVIDNIFENDYFEQLSQYSINVFAQKDNDIRFLTNHTAWEENVVRDSKLVLIHEPDRDYQMEIAEKVNAQLKGNPFDLAKTDVLFYYWMEGSYIPWHDDRLHNAAATVYLNPEWPDDWQGFFMYREGEEIKAVLPAPNRAVHNRAGVVHCTTPVLPSSYLRATLQIFEKQDDSRI